MFSKRKGGDAASTPPFSETVAKITLHAGRRLVSFLGRLREQLHYDFGDRGGDILQSFMGRQRLFGDMTMHPFNRIVRVERQGAREHLVKRDAERVEVAAGIDRTIHPPGLLRRHVGKRAGDHLWRGRVLALARKARSDAKARQPSVLPRSTNEDISRFDVLVNETACVKAPHGYWK